MVDDALWDEFHELVNMTPDELRDWLAASTGATASGEPEVSPDRVRAERSRAVVEVLGKDRPEVGDDGVAVMRSVVDEIRQVRDAGEGSAPAGDADSERLHHLMCLGHDPRKQG